MLTEIQAKKLIKIANPKLVIEDCFRYEDLWIIRIKQLEDDEANYDPFLSVNVNTGEVKEFSVLTDADPIELSKAFKRR